jgi:hypothetical protein
MVRGVKVPVKNDKGVVLVEVHRHAYDEWIGLRSDLKMKWTRTWITVTLNHPLLRFRSLRTWATKLVVTELFVVVSVAFWKKWWSWMTVKECWLYSLRYLLFPPPLLLQNPNLTRTENTGTFEAVVFVNETGAASLNEVNAVDYREQRMHSLIAWELFASEGDLVEVVEDGMDVNDVEVEVRHDAAALLCSWWTVEIVDSA